jgi:prolyl-tRNA synthetase
VPSLLATMHAELFASARRRLEDRTVDVSTVEDASAAARTGFARIPWRVLGEDGEQALGTQAVTVRCLQTADGTLPDASDDEDLFAIVGRSY